jgi:hypothetical protein
MPRLPKDVEKVDLCVAPGFGSGAAINTCFHLAMLVVSQHSLLLWTLPLPIALASLVVALATLFPLAYLFELGARSLWGSALRHAIIQGTLKVVSVPEALLLTNAAGMDGGQRSAALPRLCAAPDTTRNHSSLIATAS